MIRFLTAVSDHVISGAEDWKFVLKRSCEAGQASKRMGQIRLNVRKSREITRSPTAEARLHGILYIFGGVRAREVVRCLLLFHAHAEGGGRVGKARREILEILERRGSCTAFFFCCHLTPTGASLAGLTWISKTRHLANSNVEA